MKRNPEVRLLIRILAIIGFVILILLLAGYIFIRVRAPQLLEFSKGITVLRIAVKLDSLDEGRFIAELKKTHQPMSGNFDGRGVLVVPASSLLKLMKPLLIND